MSRVRGWAWGVGHGHALSQKRHGMSPVCVRGCHASEGPRRCYSRLTVVSDLDVEGFVLNVDGGSWQELDYNEVRTTE
jgi:hypothetical protein